MKRVGDIIGMNLTPEQPEGQPAVSRTVRPAAATPNVCPICKGKGFLIYDVPPGHPDFNRLVPCRCTEARLLNDSMRSLRSYSNLGRLEDMTFDTFLPDGTGLPESVRSDLHMTYDVCWQYAQRPEGWLILIGGYGAGKTHLAAAIANHCITLGRAALFVIVPDLLDHLRAAFGPSSEISLDERLEAVRNAPLLILDDLGAHNSTAWAQEKLFQILNHRYNNRLPTVITMNHRLEELDPRISSRLQDVDLARVINLTAPDYRLGSSALSTMEGNSRSLSSLLLYNNAPYNSMTFENFSLRRNEDMEAGRQASLERAFHEARKYAENPKGWMVFSGTYGCGKTHLAVAIANYQASIGKSAPMFVTVPDLLDYLRATFSPNSHVTLDTAFEQVKNAQLLVLDDLGTESATPWAREKLFQLLNHRYVRTLPTVITTSSAIDKIEPWLQSRMLDTARCTVVLIKAAGYRIRPAKQRGSDIERVDQPSGHLSDNTTTSTSKGSRSRRTSAS